jgi:hypothetical protein
MAAFEVGDLDADSRAVDKLLGALQFDLVLGLFAQAQGFFVRLPGLSFVNFFTSTSTRTLSARISTTPP